VNSVKKPHYPKLPYTSSVDICTNLLSSYPALNLKYVSIHYYLAASNKLKVPVMLVSMKIKGFEMLLQTWLSAAKCTTFFISYFSNTFFTSSKFLMSTFSKLYLPLFLILSSILSKFPAYVKTSRFTIWNSSPNYS
jgi:hypothetical protein